MTGPEPDLVCPDCRGPLARADGAYRCEACPRSYPILHGIADFRLRSDRYLSLEEERAKAARLAAFKGTFEQLLNHYYAITDDVPPVLAARYQGYVKAGVPRGEAILADLGPAGAPDRLLDLGCGAGGLLLAAAGRYDTLVGVDIALRWLVLCRRRLAEQGAAAMLICADVERLPLPAASFGHVAAADLLEHVYDVDRALGEVARVMRPHGTLWLSASNGCSLGPHPPSGIWAAGWLPRRWRRALLLGLRGVDSLRFTHLLTPGALGRCCRRHGLHPLQRRPKRPVAGAEVGLPRLARALLGSYRWLAALPPLRSLLVLLGPGFEMLCRREEGPCASA